jgi:tetratricopeptide (TPR) repeat protein
MKALLISVLIIISTISCKKYLDTKSDSSLVTPASIADCQALLDDAATMNTRVTPSLGQASCDDNFMLDDRYRSLLIDMKNVYTWTGQKSNYPNDWSKSYLAVYNCNLSLEILSKMEHSGSNSAAWDNVKGSALFYRAFHFFNLAVIYGKAYNASTAKNDWGIELRTTSDRNIGFPRSSLEDTYNQVLRDAKEAAGHLPDLPEHVMRPSKAAAYALLARIYLNMRNYREALVYADRCLAIKNNLLNYNDANKVAAANTVPFKEFNEEIIFYSTMNTICSGIFSSTKTFVDTILYKTYQPSDLRRKVFFIPGTYQRFKGNYTGNTSAFFSGFATDELYLTRAECYARMNEMDKAMKDLNTLLRNRYDSARGFIPVEAHSAEDGLSMILLERRKELLMRGIRWPDIKRLNVENYNIVLRRVIDGVKYELLPNDNYYALPIPNDLVERFGMPQNPD